MGIIFPNELLDLIVRNTNEKISQFKSSCKAMSNAYRPTDIIELRAFMGLRYARALLNQNHYNIEYLFQDKVGHHIFGATMDRRRYNFLNNKITFDDMDTRKERFSHDRFAAFRDFFEKFNRFCADALQPEEFLSIDETLYPCRTQIGFKQFNPSKPSKYGILFKSVNSVKYAYTHMAVVYAGKPVGTPGPYYTPGILPTVQSLMNNLMSIIDIQGTNITMDRLYSSNELFEWLLAKNITGPSSSSTHPN